MCVARVYIPIIIPTNYNKRCVHYAHYSMAPVVLHTWIHSRSYKLVWNIHNMYEFISSACIVVFIADCIIRATTSINYTVLLHQLCHSC